MRRGVVRSSAAFAQRVPAPLVAARVLPGFGWVTWRRARRASLLLFVAAALLLAPSSAAAIVGYVHVATLGSGVLPEEPRGLAVDQANGDVFVTDHGSVKSFAPVNRTSPSAGYLQQSLLSESFQSAFDVGINNTGGPSQGEVYVTDAAAGVLDKFIGTGKPHEGEPGEPPQVGLGVLSAPTGVAVDPANGELYVSDFSNSVVDVFTPTGEFVSASQFMVSVGSGPEGLAFNSTGSDLYVVLDQLGIVEEFNASGEPVDQTAGPNAGTNIVDDSGQANAVAVDTTTNQVYVTDTERVTVYASSGAPVGPEFPTGIPFSQGIAVDNATGAVYVSDYTNRLVDVFQLLNVPSLTTGPSSHVTEEEATLEGAVNPEGLAVTGCQFEYGTSTEYGQSIPCASLPGSGTQPVAVRATLDHLQPETTYHYRLSATNAEGTNYGRDATFTTFGRLAVGTESFRNVGSSSATLVGQIVAGGRPASYHFEYGATDAYGLATPETPLGSGRESTGVLAQISGLLPETTYHFRLVATGEAGTPAGPDVTLTTFPVESPGLPDGRSYESVSSLLNADGGVYEPTANGVNPEAGNGDNTKLPFAAAASGNAITYVGAPSATGGTGSEGAGKGNQYLAARSAAGEWSAENIEPSAARSNEEPLYEGFSSQLTVSVLDWNGQSPLTPGAPAGGYHVLYTRRSDNGVDKPFVETSPPNRSALDFGTPRVFHLGEGTPLAYAGASSNFEDLLFEANDALTPGAADGGAAENNLYESSHGVLALVNVLPDGAPAPNAIFGSPTEGTEENSKEDSPDFSNVISSDGARIFWTDLNTGDLYVRDNPTQPQSPLNGEECTVSTDACTVQIDRTQTGALGASGGGRFWTASGDGSEVFFTDASQLTGDSTAAPGKPDLYEYDVETGHLTDLTAAKLPGEHADVKGVVGASEDGAYVYVVATGALAPGATAQTCEPGTPSTGCNLYVLHRGEPPKLIAALSGGDDRVEPLTLNGAVYGDWRPGLGNRTSEVTPDGRHVVFMSRQSLSGYANEDKQEVYVYSVEGNRLACASCDPSGASPTSSFAAYLPPSYSNTYMHRWISSDGSRVFFDSFDQLVSQNTGGRQNVYEWEQQGAGSCRRSGGCIYLLSQGAGTDNSYLVDASANGDDVFFITRAQLVPQDESEAFVLYDAHVGAPQSLSPPLCSGLGCQNRPPAPPAFATPATLTFSGNGNWPSPAPPPVVRQKTLTRAQRLAKALRACGKKPKRQRARCRQEAEKRYGAKKAKAKQVGKRAKTTAGRARRS